MPRTTHVELDGERHRGSYSVAKDNVTVHYESRSLSQRLEDIRNPEEAAQGALTKLIKLVRDLKYA